LDNDATQWIFAAVSGKMILMVDQPWALVETLAVAVPLEIARLARIPGHRRPEVLHTLTIRAATMVSSHGDALFWPSPGRPRRRRSTVTVDATPSTPQVFAALAAGLAAAAFAPGGITWGALHWCTDHRRCQEPETP
jgi:hypothetical protein